MNLKFNTLLEEIRSLPRVVSSHYSHMIYDKETLSVMRKQLFVSDV